MISVHASTSQNNNVLIDSSSNIIEAKMGDGVVEETVDVSEHAEHAENSSGKVEPKKKNEEVELKQEEKLAKKRKLEADKESKKRKMEEEREAKRRKVEEEREAKKKKLEEEKLEKERKREEERLEKEKKREAEKLEKLRKKQEESQEKDRRKKAEQEEKERKRLADQAEKDRRREMKEREKLEKRAKLEEEKRAKELEKLEMEEEKRKAQEAKDRSQKKISSFFQAGPKRKTPERGVSQENKEVSEGKTDYECDFLPFFVQENVVFKKPKTRFSIETRQYLDSLLQSESGAAPDFHSYLSQKSHLSQINNGSMTTPESLLTALNMPTTTESLLNQMISNLPPIKYISFYENSKPPYVGTWHSEKHQAQMGEIISNPLDVQTTGFDYDYDSDLDWNEDEREGDEIDDEEEDEEDPASADEDDDETFIEHDAETSTRNLKQLVVINKWNDESNKHFFDAYSTVNLIAEDKLKCV
ncbi:uncharacterized protein LODBEIA_P48300 [Lodderomyces beijingensis]|uniref:Chromatin assembly factor 1 subunit A n=1 Tax=Lodderomyces beijingensis TaxID=1775926 RepID=A0ABP0ZUE4_9ASCO